MDLTAMLNEALRHMNAARFAEAQRVYQEILAAQPDSATAAACLNNLGNIRRAMNDAAGALALYRQAIARHADSLAAWMSLGSLLRGLGRMHEAELAFRESIRIAPNFADAHAGL